MDKEYDHEVAKKYIIKIEKENKHLKEEFKRHVDRINELTNRIDKAIEYAKDHIIEDSEYENYMQCEREEKEELLDILRGLKI